MSEYPMIVSADDHVVEPADLWTSRLPARYREQGPRVVRKRIEPIERPRLNFAITESDEGEWADIWCYEDRQAPLMMQAAAVGFDHDEVVTRAVTFDEIRPGCYDPSARIQDMNQAGIEGQLCFPNLEPVRFCGQGFVAAEDKELAKLCVQAYNDFILDEWCGSEPSRLISCGIVPLWDVELAVEEAVSTATRGMKALCFSEAPAQLGLPSLHTGYWDPLFATCEESGIVLMIHIGSSSRIVLPSEDAPSGENNILITLNATSALVDWLFSGILVRCPELKVVLAECQIGWIPYYLQRLDEIWEVHRGLMASEVARVPDPPSSYFARNMYATFFSDPFGLRNIDKIGVDNVLAETDYPHSDSTWPISRAFLQEQTVAAGLTSEQTEKIARGNAMRLFRL